MAGSGYKWLELLEMTENYYKWLEMARNDWNCWKWLEIAEYGYKCPDMAINGSNWLE